MVNWTEVANELDDIIDDVHAITNDIKHMLRDAVRDVSDAMHNAHEGALTLDALASVVDNLADDLMFTSECEIAFNELKAKAIEIGRYTLADLPTSEVTQLYRNAHRRLTQLDAIIERAVRAIESDMVRVDGIENV